jgi:alpha-tubulin suppressor-like RCC1 family protein
MGCGLNSAGAAWCWTDHSANPQQVGGGVVFNAISVGAAHACGLTSSGTSWCWGANESGQLGTLTTLPSTDPAQVQLAQPFVDISAGGHHSCGVTAAGEAYCWGAASAGQLGWGGLPPDYGIRFSAPLHVNAPGVVFQSISAGGDHTCALADDDRAYCWGENASGQVGNGVFDEQPLPTTVSLQ